MDSTHRERTDVEAEMRNDERDPRQGRRWSWPQFWIAVSFILFGVVTWFVCLAMALSGGTPGGPPYWLQHYVEKFYPVGALIGIAGALWVAAMLVRLVASINKKS